MSEPRRLPRGFVDLVFVELPEGVYFVAIAVGLDASPRGVAAAVFIVVVCETATVGLVGTAAVVAALGPAVPPSGIM